MPDHRHLRVRRVIRAAERVVEIVRSADAVELMAPVFVSRSAAVATAIRTRVSSKNGVVVAVPPAVILNDALSSRAREEEEEASRHGSGARRERGAS